MKITRNTSSQTDILRHLEACDSFFRPPLSMRVHLEDYAKKIEENAHRLEAWENDDLVALVASYFNFQGKAYISNVSTDPEQNGRGIAQRLLKETLEDAQKHGCIVAELEVTALASNAVHMYRKLGFVEVTGDRETEEGVLFFQRKLT